MSEDGANLLEGIMSKVQNLQKLVSVIGLQRKDPENELLWQVREKCANIDNNVSATREILERQRKINHETQEMERGIERNIRTFDKIIRAHTEGNGIVVDEEYIAKVNKVGKIIDKLARLSQNIEEDDEQKIDEKVETEPSISVDVLEPEVAGGFDSGDALSVIKPENPAVLKVRLTGKALLFDFDYITEEDLKSVPKYMIGRITLQQVNSFIDKINDTLQAKSEIMRKRAKLTFAEKHVVSQYKSVKQLKSNHFISEEHLLNFMGQKCLDKKSLQYIVILRHLRRMDVHRELTTKYYVLF